MGEQSNRTLPSRQAPGQQVPPSTLAALLRMRRGGQGISQGIAHEEHEGRQQIARRPHNHEQAEPPWLRVIATTLRLALRRHLSLRHGAHPNRRGTVILVALALAVISAGGLIFALSLHAVTTAPATGRPGDSGAPAVGSLGAFGATPGGRETAVWVAQQVSHDAIVACDPGMCPILKAAGFPPENLLILRSGAADPLGSDVIVATAAVRSRIGSRLRQVYAPTVIASFGSGVARLDVLAVAPDGASAYRAALTADRAARRRAGAELVGNPRIHATAVARRQLTAGRVDARLLITLAALTTEHSLRVVAFDGSAPGAADGVPLRVMDVSGSGNTARRAAELVAIRAFLLAQRAPYLPARVQLLRRVGSRTTLRVEFGAPSPLGLLGTRGRQ